MAVSALLALALWLPVRAMASDQTDRSFAEGGIVEVPKAGYLDGGSTIIDLAEAADGRILAAISGSVSGETEFGLARFGPNGTLDRSFGDGGFARPVERSHRAAQAESIGRSVTTAGCSIGTRPRRTSNG